jgi:hypothetical protein
MGTEAFWIPTVLAAVSAGGQAVNQNNANQRAQNAEVQNIAQQQQYRQQANDQVKNLTQQIATNNPQTLANAETSQFVNTLRKNEAGSAAGGTTANDPNNFGAPVSALPQNIGGASKQYQNSAKASQQETQQYGNTEAGQMSAIDSAVRQRQNEGLALNTLGTNLNLIGANSAATGFVNQLRAQAAGVSSPWASMFSNILGKGAQGMAQNGWFAPAAAGLSEGASINPAYAPASGLVNTPTFGSP